MGFHVCAFSWLLLGKMRGPSWLSCRAELTCPEACSSHPIGTFFAVGTRRGSFQSLGAISRVPSAARGRTECDGGRPGWSLWEVDGLSWWQGITLDGFLLDDHHYPLAQTHRIQTGCLSSPWLRRGKEMGTYPLYWKPLTERASWGHCPGMVRCISL